MSSFGLLHPSGALMTDPLGGLPVSFDTVDEARALLEPGARIVRLVDSSSTGRGVNFVPLRSDELDP